MFAKNKHHNEKCTVYALGNVVQNLQSTLEEKTSPRGYNPSEWIFYLTNHNPDTTNRI